MTAGIQAQNRQEIRHPIGYNLNDVIVGTVTAIPGGGADTSSLIDTVRLQGGDDEHNGKQVMIYDAYGSIVDGEESRVSDYTGSTSDATCSPVFTDDIVVGDKYEMWRVFTIEEINDAINQAIIKGSRYALQMKKTFDTFTERIKYEYNCLSGFTGISRVEYVKSIGESVVVDRCELAWTGGTNVTATLDETIEKEGNGCAKLAVAAGVAAGATLGYYAISSIDISKCDTLELWIYSSIAITAGQLQIMLDDTAACVSALETIDLPALTAATWTRCVVSLANPHSDTAIISVGLRQKATIDIGPCTIYLDYILALKSSSRAYADLANEYWELVNGSTNYLKISKTGLSVMGENTLLRLTGYDPPGMLSDDTTDCEVDPAYIISQVTGSLLINHAKSRNLDIDNREDKAKYWLGQAELGLRSMITNYPRGVRWL